jgi:hypothetical protein
MNTKLSADHLFKKAQREKFNKQSVIQNTIQSRKEQSLYYGKIIFK